MKKILLSPESGEGGAPASPTAAPAEIIPTQPQPAPPPAAATVLSGTKSERELQLEEDNRKLAETKKNLDKQNAELTDENHRLKTPPTSSAPAQPAVEEDDGRWRPFKL